MIISRTPFRVSLFGGGSDYPKWYRRHGGAVFGFAINKYCYISIRQLPPFFEYRNRIVGHKMPLHPHNLVLQMWLELGVPGALLLCVLIILILRRLTGPSLGRGMAALACGQFIAGLTVYVMSYGAWQSWWIATM